MMVGHFFIKGVGHHLWLPWGLGSQKQRQDGWLALWWHVPSHALCRFYFLWYLRFVSEYITRKKSDDNVDLFCQLYRSHKHTLKVFCLAKLSSTDKQAQNQSPMTRVFASMKKAVDKLHFRGHKGKFCQDFCDPYKIKELDGVNTPVCEQVNL